jgi:hypothetical protein
MSRHHTRTLLSGVHQGMERIAFIPAENPWHKWHCLMTTSLEQVHLVHCLHQRLVAVGVADSVRSMNDTAASASSCHPTIATSQHTVTRYQFNHCTNCLQRFIHAHTHTHTHIPRDTPRETRIRHRTHWRPARLKHWSKPAQCVKESPVHRCCRHRGRWVG